MNENLDKILGEVQAKDASVLCREVTSIGDTMDVLRAKWNVEILMNDQKGHQIAPDVISWIEDRLANKVYEDAGI